MEIRLKTAEEFRDAHVTIEIRATPEEAWRLSDRLYTADEVGHYQASEAELVAAPLRRRVVELETELERYRRAHVCTVECKPNQHTAFQGRQRVTDLEAERDEARSERDRAHDQCDRVLNDREVVRAWAEREAARADSLVVERDRALAEVERRFTQGQLADQIAEQTSAHRIQLEEAQQAQIVLATQIGKVRAQVLGPEIRRVLDDPAADTADHSKYLARRLRNVRDIVAPGGPEAPAASTSQA